MPANLQLIHGTPAQPPRSVLYVEDNEVNAMLMKALFKRRPDMQLVIAGTGQEALRLARGLNPALLLLDLRLPDCHGSELLPWLRRIDGCAEAPAIAVTADGIFDIEGTSFSELWLKPLDLLQVLRRLEDLLGPAPAAVPQRAAGSRPAGPPHLVLFSATA